MIKPMEEWVVEHIGTMTIETFTNKLKNLVIVAVIFLISNHKNCLLCNYLRFKLYINRHLR